MSCASVIPKAVFAFYFLHPANRLDNVDKRTRVCVCVCGVVLECLKLCSWHGVEREQGKERDEGKTLQIRSNYSRRSALQDPCRRSNDSLVYHVAVI